MRESISPRVPLILTPTFGTAMASLCDYAGCLCGSEEVDAADDVDVRGRDACIWMATLMMGGGDDCGWGNDDDGDCDHDEDGENASCEDLFILDLGSRSMDTCLSTGVCQPRPRSATKLESVPAGLRCYAGHDLGQAAAHRCGIVAKMERS